ncbi:MAG TPA: PepSY domain-containing protein [Pyrinomonadaceae bacterium]|jgi:uncharacterized membrane protein YkoI|nr:PepSY domain-containing protein [Pyrinomonadaceae bacterium]
MKRYLTLAVMTAIILTAGVSLAAAAPKIRQENSEAQEQARLQRQAKITMEQARETALKRAPGNVESSELEREHGKLVYSFDIRNSRGTIDEVQVSAITGKVVRVEHENKKQEADEKRQESREKTGRKP